MEHTSLLFQSLDPRLGLTPGYEEVARMCGPFWVGSGAGEIVFLANGPLQLNDVRAGRGLGVLSGCRSKSRVRAKPRLCEACCTLTGHP